MSLLAPLYVLGLLAVSLPIIFHLIRRTPRGEPVQLADVPLAVAAAAHAPQPAGTYCCCCCCAGWRSSLLGVRVCPAVLAAAGADRRRQMPTQRRVAIVVDTSASMRRGDLWQQAIATVDEVVAECRPLDQIARLYLRRCAAAARRVSKIWRESRRRSGKRS